MSASSEKAPEKIADAYRMVVEAVCNLSSADRLSALGKSEKLLSWAGWLGSTMAWIHSVRFAADAFPEQSVVDEMNVHLAAMVREMFKAWEIANAHLPKTLPPEMIPKDRPPVVGQIS